LTFARKGPLGGRKSWILQTSLTSSHDDGEEALTGMWREICLFTRALGFLPVGTVRGRKERRSDDTFETELLVSVLSEGDDGTGTDFDGGKRYRTQPPKKAAPPTFLGPQGRSQPKKRGTLNILFIRTD